jgi:hypothetical protein
MKGMTKGQWTNLKEVLLHLPIKTRNLAWKDAMDLVEKVLAGQSDIAPGVDIDALRFSVECDICHEMIGFEEDFVRKGLTGVWIHYDCHMRTAKDRV